MVGQARGGATEVPGAPDLPGVDDVSLWPAPAKLNLFLHITGRRADGYHILQSVFQFLDYADQIALDVRRDGGICLHSALPGVAPEQDLTVRAARLLQSAAGVTMGVNISVDKRLPLGGGLGGGSSDAATVLVALNYLWGLGWSEDQLASLGLQLGADVPVFVRGRAAWAEGVGEILSPIELPEPWFLVLIPPVTVSTAEIFSAPELTRDTPPLRIPAFLAGAGDNDCAFVVRTRYPVIGQYLDWLSQFGRARLTGTGACVFAAFPDQAAAQQVLAQRPVTWQGFVAQGRNRSPLQQKLEQNT